MLNKSRKILAYLSIAILIIGSLVFIIKSNYLSVPGTGGRKDHEINYASKQNNKKPAGKVSAGKTTPIKAAYAKNTEKAEITANKALADKEKFYNNKLISSERIEFDTRSSTNANQNQTQNQLNFSISSRERTRADISCSVNDIVIDTVQMKDGNEYSRIKIDGFGQSGEVGSPELPAKNQLIRKTGGSEVALVIDDVIWQEIPGDINLVPVQQPIPDVVTLNGERPDKNIPFEKNDIAYSVDEYVNTAPV